MAETEAPSVDEAIEQAWTNLYAKLDVVAPIKVAFQGEDQARQIIRSLGQELAVASKALQHFAESFKYYPTLTVPARLKLANGAMSASRRAREAAESVLG